MSRKSAPATSTITDRDELIAVCTQALVAGAGETYEGIEDRKRWLAVAIADRDFNWLQDLAAGYRERDKQVFGDLTGVRLPKNNRKQTYRLIRQWCGLSDAWQANEEAGKALRAAEEAVRQKHRNVLGQTGDQYFDSVVLEVDRILDEGYTVVGETPEGTVLLNPDVKTQYYPLKLKSRKRRAVLQDAVPYVVARIAARTASAAYAAEVEAKRRASASQMRERAPAALASTAIYFL